MQPLSQLNLLNCAAAQHDEGRSSGAKWVENSLLSYSLNLKQVALGGQTTSRHAPWQEESADESIRLHRFYLKPCRYAARF
jgi:hypothetical protein